MAGAVQLHSPGHGEYLIHLNPSHSCAYIYEEGQVRFYSKSTDYASKEEQMEKQANTSNMLKILTDITAIQFSHLHHLSETFDKLVNAEHH